MAPGRSAQSHYGPRKGARWRAGRHRAHAPDRPALLFRWLAVASSLVFAFTPVIAAAQSVPAGTTQIIPDGRTATAVTSNGSVTSVTTRTIAGGNAYNSFSQFKVGTGNSANLYVPDQSRNLINMVHSGPVVVDGILNSYQNGKIGGNVYFADPYGFVVGKSGVINTGALTVTTPSRAFVDTLISPSGQIGAAATQALIDGNFPLSPDGTIAIRGRINAADGVRLMGQTVIVGGSGSQKLNENVAQGARFAATVNSKGLRNASGIVVRNGSIRIVAGGGASVNGRLTARSRGKPNDITVTAANVTLGSKARLSADSKNRNAGNIAVRATSDIAVKRGATLSAKSQAGTGGNIAVFADGNLNVASGARLDASSQQSDAGFIELSAKKAATIGTLDLNLSAPNGKAGTLLLDPFDLVIDGASSITSNGANVVLLADNSITVDTGGVIDTRMFNRGAGILSAANASTGNSGTVSITAPTIFVSGSILTNVVNTGGSTWSAGDVALTATSTNTALSSSHTAATKILVAGTIDASVVNGGIAGDIRLIATSTSTAYEGEVVANSEVTVSRGQLTGRDVIAQARSVATSSFSVDAPGNMAQVAATIAGSALGVNGGYVAATTSAKVTVDAGAVITATRDVTLEAHATETAANPAMVLPAASPLGASVVVGAIDATVATRVFSSASVQAGRNLAVNARNEANTAVSALVVTTAGIVDATVAYTKVRVNTSAAVDTGTDIAASNVSVLGSNTNSFSTSATVMAFGAGSAGGAVAYSDIATSVTANFGASLGSTGTPITGGLTVEALSDTQKLSTSASTQVGNNIIANTVFGGLSPGFVTALTTPLFGSELGVKGAAALALTSSSQTASASIDGDAATQPKIQAAGDVAVISRVIDSAIRNNASGETAASNTSPSGPSITVAAGVAYGTYRHESTAFVGNKGEVSGRNIGVAATTDLPNENTWLQNWQTGKVSDFLSHINGNAGTVNNVLTSYANATAQGLSNLSVAGSVSYFEVTNKTTAWVATDAKLTQSDPGHAGACASAAWCTQQSNGDRLDWSAPISISATTQVRSIDVAGNYGIFSLTGTSSDGSGIGGSLNMVQYNNTTIAGIARGATVSSDTQVAVSAWTNDVFFAVAPTSGIAAGTLSLNGIASYAAIHDKTYASIDNFATVAAPTIAVKATENLQLMSIAGAVTSGGTAGVGLAVAVLDVATDTKAYIGANADDRPSDPLSSATAGYVHADNLTVYGVTTGQLTIASLAAAESDPSSQGKTFANRLKAGLNGRPDNVAGALGGVNAARNAVQAVANDAPPSFSIDIAGSSSAAVTKLSTTASVEGASIDRFDTSGGRANLDVEALNNTFIHAGSGSAAANFTGNPGTTTVAVGGSIAVGTLTNASTASISSSAIANAGDVTVRALGAGEETLVGLGLSVAVSVGQTSGAASLSGSVGLVTDSVNATVSGSTITGVTGGTGRDVVVQAYQTTDIGIGAGALYAGLKGGVGISVTYVQVNNPSTQRNAADASLSSTTITDVDTLTVSAVDAARVSSGAAVAGAQTSGGLAGAFVINAISPTISASIIDNGASQIRLTGDLVVTASGMRNATLDSKVRNDSIGVDGAAAPTGAGTFDFDGGGIVSGGTNAGATIVAVAGQLSGGGGNNVGVSVVSNTIAQTYQAQIGTSDIQSSGDVLVAASDSSKILAVAVGVGVSSGQFGGTGSLVLNRVNDVASATIGGIGATTANTVIKGDQVAVAAANSGSIQAAAGTVTISVGSAGVGLSDVTNIVGNTVTAAIDGGKVEAGKTVVVSGTSTTDIGAVAIGAAISQNASLAGSAATSRLSTNVTARISGGADVTADNNVGVLASNTDSVRVVAGALGASSNGVGLDASVVVNEISGNTRALISGSTVDAKATNAADTLLVNSGQLVHAIDLGAVHAPTDSTPDMTESQQAVHGLAVIASSHQAVVANAVSAGASGRVAVSLTPVTNLMGGTTEARIDGGAAIDTRLTMAAGSAAPQLEVLASSYSYAGNFALGIAAGSSVGGGAAAIGIRMDRTTHAVVTDALIGSIVAVTDSTTLNGTTTITKTFAPTTGAVRVRAIAEQDASDIVTAGGAGGSAGIAASGAVTLYNADTQAYVAGSRVTAQSLAVNAASRNGLFAASGAGAYGGTAGVGTAFDVTITTNNTLAYVGATGVTTLINLTGALEITADSANTFNTYAVGGAGAGTAGIAGMANATTVSNVTVAGLYNIYVNKQPAAITAGVSGTDSGGNPTLTFDYTLPANNSDKLLSVPAGNVTVRANESINVFQVTGALGVGGNAGIGASVGVVIIKSGVTAESASSSIVSAGTVAINATSAKSVETWEVTGAAGFSAGIGAAVGVVIIGSNSTDPDSQSDQNAQAGGTVTAANSFAASTGIAAPATSLGGATDGITARITDGSVRAQSLNVAATGQVQTSSHALGAGFAALVGVGAAVGYTSIISSVSADVAPTSATVGAMTVNASMADQGGGHAVDQLAVAGGGALAVGASAAVSVAAINNSVTTSVGGTLQAASIDAAATDSTSGKVTTTGVSVAVGGAVGASVAQVTKTSDVEMNVAGNAVLVGGTLAFKASERGAVTADATAMTGGAIAGNGAAAIATDNGTVKAEIKGAADVSYNDLTLAATAAPETQASAFGVSAGVAGIGASVALATGHVHVTAAVNDNVKLTSPGKATIAAAVATPTSGTSARADSTAGAGGVILGANASISTAEIDADVAAYIGKTVTLRGNSSLYVTADNSSKQWATSTGITAGFAAAGGNEANATAHGSTTAYVDSGLDTLDTRIGVLSLTATGTKTNIASVVTGSGGVVAGAAGSANTRDDVTTLVEIRNDGGALKRLYGGDFILAAGHVSSFAAQVEATQAAAVGFSGALGHNTVNTPVTVNVADGLRLNSVGDIIITASNEAANNVSFARGGGGGVLNGQAVEVTTDVTSATTVNIGANTWLSVNGDPLLYPGKLEIEAWNRYTERSAVSMAAGGVFEGGGALDRLTAHVTNTINIGQNAVLFSVGQIQIGTATQASINGSARAELWGLIGGAGAETDMRYDTAQSVTIAAGAQLTAYDLITVNVGRLGDGTRENAVSIGAHTDLYNNTVVPISALARGTAASSNDNTLTIASTAKINGVGNVSLGAYESTRQLDGTGTGYNPYLALFSLTNHDDNIEGADSARVILNGTVAAGIHAQQNLAISEAGVASFTGTTPIALVQVDGSKLNPTFISAEQNNIYYATGTSNPKAEAQARIDALTTQRATATGKDLDRINGQLASLNAIINSLVDGQVTTVAFGNLFASGGDISINSSTLSGIGSLTASGAAAITINHDSPNYLMLSNIAIANTQGGHVRFSGGGLAPLGMSVIGGDTTTAPKITINANYQASRALNDPPPNPPLIMLQGAVSNPNGNLSIFNKFGDLAIYNSIDVASLNVNLPNGRMVVDLGDRMFSTAGSFASLIGNYSNRPMTPKDLVYMVINEIFNDGTFTNELDFNRAIYARSSNPFAPTEAGRISIFEFFGIINSANGGDNYCITGHCGYIPELNRTVDFIPLLPRTGVITAAYDPSRIVQGSSLIRAGQVFITANIIDVNGPVIAGRVDNWSIRLDAAATTQIGNFRAQHAAGLGNLFDITTASVVNGGDQIIKATYDAVNDQIVLGKVTNGVAGYIYLNGTVVSTNTFGNLQVNAGYANVNIVNTTGVALSTGTITAGQATPGIIQIVDGGGGGPLPNYNPFTAQTGTMTTWYVYTPGAALPLSVYSAPGSSINDYRLATLLGSYAMSSTAYQPQPNAQLLITDNARVTRSIGGGSIPTWQWDLTLGPGQRTDNPYYVSDLRFQVFPSSSYFRQVNVVDPRWFQNLDQDLTSDFHGIPSKIHTNITDDIQVWLNYAVKADFPIAVTFNSNGTGSVTINSNAAVKVAGAIDNATGATRITAPSIIQGAGGLAGGNSIDLQASNGIGSSSSALAVSLTGGALTANTTSGDINIAAVGTLKLNRVSAPGDVKLSATNDIVSAGAMNIAGTPTVSGRNITLSTSGGAIGATTALINNNPAPTNIQPLLLQATPTTLANGQLDGGVISASASTAVYLVQQNGDLRVGKVASDGAVFLMAAAQNGQPANILNGVSKTQDAATEARLADVWTDLNLTGNDGSAAVRAYESVVNRNFQEYLQFTKLMTMLDGGIAADRNAALSIIKAQDAVATGASVASISDAAARSYAQSRLANLTSYLAPASFDPMNPTTAYVTTDLAAAVASRDATFRYNLPTTSAVYTNLTTGAQWTLNQLKYTINSSAVSGGVSPTVSQLPINVSGRQVMLYAPTGSIGNTDPRLVVNFASNDLSSLTDAVKTRLTLAGPGDLTVQTTTDSNNITHYTLGLTQTNLVVAGALGPVSAKARSNIFLGGSTDLSLGGADASLFPTLPVNYAALAPGVQSTNGGEVRLDAGGSILNGTPGQTVISGNISLLNLVAEGGSIGLPGTGNPGANPNAIIVSLTGGGVFDSGRATSGIYFRQSAGDLIVGNLFGGNSTNGVMQLAASGSIYAKASFTDPSVAHIDGKSLDLRADSGKIGFNGASYQPLQVSLAGGALTGNALGDIAVLSPTTDLTVGAAGTFGGLATTNGAITLAAGGGNLVINTSLAAIGALSLSANQTLAVLAGTSGALRTLSSTGTVAILAAVLDMQAFTAINAATDINIVTTGALTARALTSTAGNIFASADGNASFTTVSVTATTGANTITLKSTGGTLSLDGASAQGAIDLEANGALTISANGNVTSRGSRIVVTAGSLDMQSGSTMNASTGIAIATVGALTAKALATSTGDLFASAGGDAGFTTAAITATTGSDKITLKSTGGALSLDNASAQGAIEIDASISLTLNASGQLTSRGSRIDVTAASLDMRTGSTMAAATGIRIETTGLLTAQGLTTATGDLFASAGGGASFTTAAITATTGTDKITLTSTGGALSLDSASGQGAIELGAAGALTLNANGTVASRGSRIDATAGSLDMQTGSSMTAATGIRVETVNMLTAKGLTTATGDLFASAGGTASFTTAAITTTTGLDKITLKSTGGALNLDSASGQGAIELGAAGALTLNTNGAVTSRGSRIDVTAGSLTMQTGSTMTAATGIRIETVNTLAAKGLSTATGDLIASAGGDASFTAAAITATTGTDKITFKSTGGALSIDGASAQGAIDLAANGTLTLNANGNVASRGSRIDVTAASLGMQSGSTMFAASGIRIETVNTLVAKGLSTATGDLFASAGGDASFTTAAITATTGTDKITLKSTSGALSLDQASGQGAIGLGAAGALTLNTNGAVTSRGGRIDVTAGSLTMQTGSTMNAATGIRIETVNALAAKGLTTATGDLFASAGGDASFTTAAITTTAGTDKITLKSTGSALSLDQASGQGAIELGAAGALTLNANGAVTSRGSRIDITAGSLGMQTGSTMNAATGIRIEMVNTLAAKALSTATGDLFASAGGDASFTTAAITATTGTDKITLKSTGGALTLDGASGQDAIELGAAGALTLNTNGAVTSRGRWIDVAAGSLGMQSGSSMTAATGIRIETVNTLAAKALSTATGDLFASAGGDASFTTAAITATTGTDKITLKSTGGALSLDGASGQGAIELGAAGALTLNPNGTVTSRGSRIDVTAGSLDMQTGSTMNAATDIRIETVNTLVAKTLTTSGGLLASAGGALSLDRADAQGAINLASNGALTLTGNGTVTSGGSRIDVTAGSLDMQAGSSMSAATGLRIETTGALIAKSLTTATGDLFVSAGGDANFTTAAIAATTGFDKITLKSIGGTLSLDGASGQGAVELAANGALTLNAGGNVTSRGSRIDVTAGSLDMKAGSTMVAGGAIGIVTGGDTVVGQLVSLDAPAAPNTASISVEAGRALASGAILSNGDGRVNMITTRPNTALALKAGGGIGVAPAAAPIAIKVDVPWLAANTATGDINIVGFGDLHVTAATSGSGTIGITTSGTMAIDQLKGSNVALDTPGRLFITDLQVTGNVKLGATDIAVGITQTSGAPLHLDLTGPQGGIANSINATINAPAGIIFDRLKAADATVTANSDNLTIRNGFVDRLLLDTKGQAILVDNHSPIPVVGPSLQLWGPTNAFTLVQTGNLIVTNDFVVGFQPNAAVTALSVHDGMSFIRDFPRDMFGGEPLQVDVVRKDGRTFYVMGLSPSAILDALTLPKAVDTIGSGPAVNLDGLY